MEKEYSDKQARAKRRVLERLPPSRCSGLRCLLSPGAALAAIVLVAQHLKAEHAPCVGGHGLASDAAWPRPGFALAVIAHHGQETRLDERVRAALLALDVQPVCPCAGWAAETPWRVVPDLLVVD
jgi:hypothetical protein